MTDEIRKQTRKLMKRRGISVSKLAYEIDMDRPNLSRILNGRSAEVPESWLNILDVLGVELTLK
jgi:transcriptional regulator with XRE-family HTH domain